MDTMSNEAIDAFWERYETADVATAMDWLVSATGSMKALEGDVPALVTAARERDIDLIKFLKELDEYFAKEKEDDTPGISDDGSELRDDSGSSTDSTEDQVGSEPDGSDDSRADSQADD